MELEPIPASNTGNPINLDIMNNPEPEETEDSLFDSVLSYKRQPYVAPSTLYLNQKLKEEGVKNPTRKMRRYIMRRAKKVVMREEKRVERLLAGQQESVQT